MNPAYNTIASVASAIASVAGLTAGITMGSPPLISASTVSLLLSAIYLSKMACGKRINTLMPFIQTVAIAIATTLTLLVETKSYPGFIFGVIPYPIVSGAAIACLIGYAGLRFYREIIMVFIVFLSCAISNFTCVIVYALYESEFDKTVTNASNTQELAVGVLWSMVCIAIFWIYSRYVTGTRFYDETTVLEAPE